MRCKIEGKMGTFIQPIQKHNRLAIVSFALGLMTVVFPVISIMCLIVANGGPGYLQSLFCGIPVALGSIITGIVSLAQARGNDQKGSWMAAVAIGLGISFFPISCSMAYILLQPYLFDIAR
jgi:hypothetical protein